MDIAPTSPSSGAEVLVVGAGPTGLTLACALARFGVRFRIIDQQPERTRESRALGVQARSLEVLQALGLGEELARRGQTAVRLMLHSDRGAPLAASLGDIGQTDTRFPYILIVSQSETEAVLAGYLESRGCVIERGVELAAFQANADGFECTLRRRDDREESCRVRYLVGCDGAHSAVRKGSGIAFTGGEYPQLFALGDVEADGPLEPGAIHAFGLGPGLALFFPLGHPTTWRVMAIRAGEARRGARSGPEDDVTTHELSLAELQVMVAGATGGSVSLRDPAWLTHFRLHHRQARCYRQENAFLAGDAAHIHSPVGAQGMNTGIQDAWNLGWKLALVIQGRADARLLDSYHAERWPVGRTLLRVTDRLFGTLAESLSGNRVFAALRRVALRTVVAPAMSRPSVRSLAFRFISQLNIGYRASPVVAEGKPALRRGPKAGDRLPDARVRRGLRDSWLQQELSAPCLHLLLCGPAAAWDQQRLAEMQNACPGLLTVSYLTRESSATALVDAGGEALARLGIRDSGQYLVRPDGHVAFRCGGTGLVGVTEHLRRWFLPSFPASVD